MPVVRVATQEIKPSASTRVASPLPMTLPYQRLNLIPGRRCGSTSCSDRKCIGTSSISSPGATPVGRSESSNRQAYPWSAGSSTAVKKTGQLKWLSGSGWDRPTSSRLRRRNFEMTLRIFSHSANSAQRSETALYAAVRSCGAKVATRSHRRSARSGTALKREQSNWFSFLDQCPNRCS